MQNFSVFYESKLAGELLAALLLLLPFLFAYLISQSSPNMIDKKAALRRLYLGITVKYITFMLVCAFVLSKGLVSPALFLFIICAYQGASIFLGYFNSKRVEQ